MGKIITIFAFAFAFAFTTSGVEAQTYSTGGGHDLVIVGAVTTGGFGPRAAICINNSLTILSSSANLVQDLTINTQGGSDTVRFIRFTGSSIYCSTSNWAPVNFDGYSAYIDAGTDNDFVEGPSGSSNVTLAGQAGNDMIYNYSTSSFVWGAGGNDDIVSPAIGGNVQLFGFTGDDCIWRSPGTIGNCECGGQSGDARINACNGCPNIASCCGFC